MLEAKAKHLLIIFFRSGSRNELGSSRFQKMTSSGNPQWAQLKRKNLSNVCPAPKKVSRGHACRILCPFAPRERTLDLRASLKAKNFHLVDFSDGGWRFCISEVLGQ